MHSGFESSIAPYLAAAHAVATVVTEVAVSVSDGDAAAIVTARRIHLESSELLVRAELSCIGRPSVVARWIAVTARQFGKTGQQCRPFG